ncbi:MAG: hypothetical protein HHAS10_09110 [Candidatus Altimarinota bacterium]
MIYFDKLSLETWKKEGVNSLSVFFYKSGCAGTKIQVERGKNSLCNKEIVQDDITLYIKDDESALLENARITQAGSKWIFTSQNINTRCGCGSSFSLKSDSPLKDKVERLRIAMKQKQEGIHK